MIFADASALVAMLLSEPDGPALAARLEAQRENVWISPVVRYEVVMALAKERAGRAGRSRLLPHDIADAGRALDALLAKVDAREASITPEVGRLALDAAARFGKLSGHPARLNMGDCLAHACARSLGATLLYKGEDFARTDLA